MVRKYVDGLATTDNEAELAQAIANLPKLRKPTGNSFSPVWNVLKLITDARTHAEIPGKTHICQFCNHYLKLHWNESKAVKRSRGGGFIHFKWCKKTYTSSDARNHLKSCINVEAQEYLVQTGMSKSDDKFKKKKGWNGWQFHWKIRYSQNEQRLHGICEKWKGHSSKGRAWEDMLRIII